jgi:ABC-2 type transport system ATP-binding protein
MDEAERCHRLAILDRGALVADGTPAELSRALSGRTVLVHAAQPRRVQQALAQAHGVLSAAQIGNTLRVLTDAEGDPAQRVRDALAAARLDARVEPVAPSLEDVFVAATHGRTDRPAEHAA